MSILILAEHDNAVLNAATLNSVTAALEIGGDIDLLVAGKDCGTVADQARKHFGDRLFDTEIPRLVAIAESPLDGAPIVIGQKPNKSNPGSTAYWELAQEASKRIDRIHESR